MGYLTLGSIKLFFDDHLFTSKCNFSDFNRDPFKFYLVIFLLHLVTQNLLNWYRVNCEKINDHILICLFFWWFSKLLIISGNVHTNPGPSPSPRYEGLLKFMHWNVNSLSAHDFICIPLIQSLNSYNDYGIIAITETALNRDTPGDRLALEGFFTNQKRSPTWEHSWWCHDILQKFLSSA